jgi:hypothetical protein
MGAVKELKIDAVEAQRAQERPHHPGGTCAPRAFSHNGSMSVEKNRIHALARALRARFLLWIRRREEPGLAQFSCFTASKL